MVNNSFSINQIDQSAKADLRLEEALESLKKRDEMIDSTSRELSKIREEKLKISRRANELEAEIADLKNELKV